MTTLVTIRDVHKVFHRGSERIDVLQGVNVDIPQGDFLALMGPSGSGKTTLLNLLGGLDRPTGGTVEEISVAAATNGSPMRAPISTISRASASAAATPTDRARTRPDAPANRLRRRARVIPG